VNALVPPRAEFVLLCPKAVSAEWWYFPQLQRQVALLHAPFPADPRLRDAVRLLGPPQAPVLFVGDMDPVAIAHYLEAERMFSGPEGVRLGYGGMNDAWLEAMGGSNWPLARLSIRMSAPERRLLRVVESEVPLDDLVGPDCAELLRSGFKVELEAGLNPAFHGAAHKRWVFGYLRDMAVGTSGGKGGTLSKSRRTKR
jgi:hypothetical protein